MWYDDAETAAQLVKEMESSETLVATRLPVRAESAQLVKEMESSETRRCGRPHHRPRPRTTARYFRDRTNLEISRLTVRIQDLEKAAAKAPKQ